MPEPVAEPSPGTLENRERLTVRTEPKARGLEAVGVFVLGGLGTLWNTLRDGATSTIRYLGHLGSTLRAMRRLRWGAVIQHASGTGVEAVPILILIGSLMGMILAMLAAEQLRAFGADIFVAQLVTVALTREVGPLMTGVLVAGRSAAGYAAEVGTMKINQEVSALRTMGLDVHEYLFTPRFVATILVMPCLALLTDVTGILGGVLIGVSSLHLTFNSYYEETLHALQWRHLLTGLGKSVCFGAVIALVGTVKGFLVIRGARQVGRAARGAVVLAIILIVVTDAIFTAVAYGGR